MYSLDDILWPNHKEWPQTSLLFMFTISFTIYFGYRFKILSVSISVICDSKCTRFRTKTSLFYIHIIRNSPLCKLNLTCQRIPSLGQLKTSAQSPKLLVLFMYCVNSSALNFGYMALLKLFNGPKKLRSVKTFFSAQRTLIRS